MSNLLDDLARTLATPMPRRRAVWLAAGALVAGALPGGRTRAAAAATNRAWTTKAGCGKGGGGIPCAKQFGPHVSECCGPIDKSDPDSNYTCCPPGECWHHGTGRNSVTTCCPPAYRCKGRCCSDGEKCVEGECTRCEDEKVCGKSCCEDSEVCADPKRSLCCVKTWKQCRPGQAGPVKCCPPRDECCYNKATKKVTCCDANHPCTDGRCKCGKGEKRCGETCCTKDQECSDGKCCPKGKVNCGDERCCDKGLCCGKVCCAKNEFCAASIAYSKPKVCCTSARILVLPSGKPVCCPLGTVPNAAETGCCPAANPNCCDGGASGDDPLICLGPNSICVRGICQKAS
jgi:hypothetical protein